MKNNKKDKKNQLKLVILFILGGFLVKLFSFLCQKKKLGLDDVKDNLDDFVEEEKKEIEELANGEESLDKYCQDSINIFKDYFIPHDGNDNRPKILRTKPLLIVLLFSLLLKAGVLGYLFFIYPNMAQMQQQITTEILALVNQDRQNNNLPILEMNSILSSAAQNKANDMLANNYFSHYSPDGKEPWDWINRTQYPYLYVGENLAMNFSSADSAHLALMASELHKKNILNSNFQDIGLAVVSGEINGESTTLLVELFGSQKETKPIVLTVATGESNETNINPAKPTPDETEVLSIEQNQPEIKIDVPAPLEDKTIAAEAPIPLEDKTIAAETKIDTNKLATTEIKTENEEKNVVTQIEPSNNLNEEILYVAPQSSKKFSLAANLVKFSEYIYGGLIIVALLILIIDILVRITIQDKSIIVQSLLVIVILIGLLFFKFHILEEVIEQIIII